MIEKLIAATGLGKALGTLLAAQAMLRRAQDFANNPEEHYRNEDLPPNMLLEIIADPGAFARSVAGSTLERASAMLTIAGCRILLDEGLCRTEEQREAITLVSETFKEMLDNSSMTKEAREAAFKQAFDAVAALNGTTPPPSTGGLSS